MKYKVIFNLKPMRGVKRLAVVSLWLVGGGLLVGTVFVGAFYVAMRQEMRSTEVEVPDLSGLTVEAAEQAAAPMALSLEVVDRRNDPRVANGRVLQQMPPAGALVRRGRKVKLILSLGGKVLEVPELVGHTAHAVAIELRQGGFQAGDAAQVFSHHMPAGKVIAQVPPARTTTMPNSRVHWLVSAGRPGSAWVMPDLVGLNRAQAERWLSLSGLRQGTTKRRRTPGKEPGVVVGQRPAAGYPVRSKDIVELTVAE